MTHEEAIAVINRCISRECPIECAICRGVDEAMKVVLKELNGRVTDANVGDGWISVKDRLPEAYGNYLVYLGMPDRLVFGNGVHMAWYYNGSKCFSFSLNTAIMLEKDSSADVRSVSVTHWRPLPAPPKDEKGETDGTAN